MFKVYSIRECAMYRQKCQSWPLGVTIKLQNSKGTIICILGALWHQLGWPPCGQYSGSLYKQRLLDILQAGETGLNFLGKLLSFVSRSPGKMSRWLMKWNTRRNESHSLRPRLLAAYTKRWWVKKFCSSVFWCTTSRILTILTLFTIYTSVLS